MLENIAEIRTGPCIPGLDRTRKEVYRKVAGMLRKELATKRDPRTGGQSDRQKRSENHYVKV